MDDIDADEEYDAPPVENFDTGDGDDDDDVDGEANEVGEDYVDPVVVLLQQLNMDAATDQDVIDLTLNNSQELYVGLRFNDKKSLRRTVKIYFVQAHHNFKVYYSCVKYEEYRCPEFGVSCNWKV